MSFGQDLNIGHNQYVSLNIFSEPTLQSKYAFTELDFSVLNALPIFTGTYITLLDIINKNSWIHCIRVGDTYTYNVQYKYIISTSRSRTLSQNLNEFGLAFRVALAVILLLLHESCKSSSWPNIFGFRDTTVS